MKKVLFGAFSILLLVLSGCDDDKKLTFTIGIKGTMKYGKGDCMPIIDPTKRVYKNYDGVLYFISKSEFDKLDNGDFKKLKAKSLKTKVSDGKFQKQLPVGEFVLFPSKETIRIIEGVVLKKDFMFWICTTY